MRNMLKTIHKQLSAGEDLVLVTVIASSGATPRGAGARMLIGKEGRICGTIGGGAVESTAIQIAATVLEEKRLKLEKEAFKAIKNSDGFMSAMTGIAEEVFDDGGDTPDAVEDE